MCVYVSVCKYVHVSASAPRVQKRVSDPPELELQWFVVMSCLTWILGTKLRPLQKQSTVITTETSLQRRTFHLTSFVNYCVDTGGVHRTHPETICEYAATSNQGHHGRGNTFNWLKLQRD